MICLFTNRHLCGELKLLLKIREASLAGAAYIYLRENDLSDEAYLSLARSAQQMMTGTRTELVVCHRNQIAEQLQVKSHNRYSERTELSFTLSVHNEDEIRRTKGYFFYSPFFKSKCKPGVMPVGLKLTHERMIALGGINLMTIKEIRNINHIGVMSEWLETEDVFQLIKLYQSYGY